MRNLKKSKDSISKRRNCYF